jgi:transaldolase
MTSNPSIFEKALAEGTAYDTQIASLAGELAPAALFEAIATDDVRTACDMFRDVFRDSGGTDGFVSIEVSPDQAGNARGSVDEARRLWTTVDRPNVMVKVPGTREGAKAIRQLTADGINVNVTLLFSIDAHARVIEAYLAGLEARVKSGQPVDHLSSVASFFVSRVDTEVDKRLEALAATRSGPEHDRILGLRGQAAIANARRAYRLFQERFSGSRWQHLAARGARVQRPLWASTSTKNKAYRDVMYVEALIGPDTVNTMPPATIEAFRDHGVARRTVDENPDAADALFDELAGAGIAFDDVTDQLLTDGVAAFAKSFDAVVKGLERKAAALVSAR